MQNLLGTARFCPTLLSTTTCCLKCARTHLNAISCRDNVQVVLQGHEAALCPAKMQIQGKKRLREKKALKSSSSTARKSLARTSLQALCNGDGLSPLQKKNHLDTGASFNEPQGFQLIY